MAYLDYSRAQRGENFLISALPSFDESDINLDTSFVYDNYIFIDGKGDLRGYSLEYWGRDFDDSNSFVVTDVNIFAPYGEVYYRGLDWRLGELANADASTMIQDLVKGYDEIYGTSYDDKFVGGLKADLIEGRGGDDFIHGQHGADILEGGAGNDTIRGGHGADYIDAGNGSDWVWGGIGQNTIYAGALDGAEDKIYVPVDSVQNKEFGNPRGANFDDLWEVGAEDKIFMHGVDDSALTYGSSTYEGFPGTTIYANGTAEAWVALFNPAEVDAMTTGGFFA